MEPSTNTFHAISPHLPEPVLNGLRSTPVDELALDNLVRLISGAEPSPHSTSDVRAEWSAKQTSIAALLSSFGRSDSKRSREDTEAGTATKRPRLSPPETTSTSESTTDTGRLVYSLQPVSATAPVRKKVEINIRENAIIFLNSATKAPEGPPIPLSILRRAFLLPTRGKTKPHWTVVILSSDYQPITARGKPATATSDEKPQIIFGVDAKLNAALEVTTYDAEGKSTTTTHARNTESLPILRQFLTQLHIPILEPSLSVFKSAVPGLSKNVNPDGVPGIEAYRSAKPGSLWFMHEGILWGESKPCEFWAVEDLIGKTEGLKIIGGIGKTCSVILTRRSRPPSQDKDAGDKNTSEGATADDEPEEDLGEETEFSMVDSKEKEGIDKWVKEHRHIFGTAGGRTPVEDSSKPEKVVPTGPLTIHSLANEIDSSDDEDFAASSDDDSAGSGDSNSEDSGDEDEDETSEAEEGGEGEDDARSGASDEEEEGLDFKHHPLLRAGRLPRMSKAAMDVAVGMVVDDMVGSDEEEEVDELMD
ncbi:hypothetical protein D9756_007888 [Leucocoprinus leucothites]|uniref:Histone chaperone RTT106/FACT complex subunit SPT16-like middle domain-containing protein n=1 Tax=Leucocoprinus leucothites TaxID=201217 RepID=A0A8H5D785_9AGAR|nr:hypothetical protein D9756_007888 [Leucoagaricus leucothites]